MDNHTSNGDGIAASIPFRSFNLPPGLDDLPFGVLELVIRLSRHFNFTTGTPTGRERLGKRAAAAMLGLSRTTFDHHLGDLFVWSRSTGWWYLDYDRRTGLTLAVSEHKVGVQRVSTNRTLFRGVSNHDTLSAQKLDTQCSTVGHSVSTNNTLTVPNMDTMATQQLEKARVMNTLRTLSNI